MAIIIPNMGKKFIDNPPFIQNCPLCGAEAEIGGQTMWEWWEHYIRCSNYTCDNYKKIESGTSPVSDIIFKWNNLTHPREDKE